MVNGYILSIESSTPEGSAAVVDSSGVEVHSVVLGDDTRHGKGLITAVAECADHIPEGLSSISGIAVDVGPGSFTGLRVGVISAKALAWARGVPVVGIHSLSAIAWPLHKIASTVAVTSIARKNEAYLAVYSCSDEILSLTGDICAYSPDDLYLMLNELAPDTLIAGNGTGLLADDMLDNIGDKFRIDFSGGHPSAVAVAQLGLLALKGRPEGDDLHKLQPLYPRQKGVSMPILGEEVQGTCRKTP